MSSQHFLLRGSESVVRFTFKSTEPGVTPGGSCRSTLRHSPSATLKTACPKGRRPMSCAFQRASQQSTARPFRCGSTAGRQSHDRARAAARAGGGELPAQAFTKSFVGDENVLHLDYGDVSVCIWEYCIILWNRCTLSHKLFCNRLAKDHTSAWISEQELAVLKPHVAFSPPTLQREKWRQRPCHLAAPRGGWGEAGPESLDSRCACAMPRISMLLNHLKISSVLRYLTNFMNTSNRIPFRK